VVGGARAAVLGATVDLAQTADTDGLAHVDVTGDSGGTDVVPSVDNLAEVRHLGPWKKVLPVDALRRKLLKVTGLDSVAPTCRQKSCQHLFKERFTRHSSLVPHEIQVSPNDLFQCPCLLRKTCQVIPLSQFLLFCVRDPRDGGRGRVVGCLSGARVCAWIFRAHEPGMGSFP
jgi:hypothetical protein